MSRAAVLALAFATACCGESPVPPAGSGDREPPRRRPVVDEAIAALEARFPDTPLPEADPELEEQVRGLLGAAAGRDARLGRVAQEELGTLGAPAIAPLRRALLDREAGAGERRAAAEALADIDLPASAAALLEPLARGREESEREPWLYAWCAWQVGRTRQDQAVPALLLALRYETDHPTVVWIGDSLARMGNLAGVEALWVVARTSPDERARAEALAVLGRVAAELGAETEELAALWARGDPRLPAEVLSPLHELALWRQVRALREWQLRGVDDARYVLSRCREGAAAILARALEDEDRYVRVHAAQCLERMGPRGRAAAPALIAALGERELAPGAALALGALGHAAAEPDLRALLAAEHPMELRVAAATAVGRLALEASVPALAALVSADEPVDLRAAAATALLACAPAGAPEARQALAVLADQLRERAVDLVGVEQALHAWLERAAPGDEASREALRAFEASAAEPPEERLRGRHQALRVLLGER